jgi:preprotein translocase subunit SecD
MTICKQHGNRLLFFHAVLSTAIALFTTALNAGELSENAPGAANFEVRPASYEKVEGWESVPDSVPVRQIWVAPEAALINTDVAQAQPDQFDNGKPCVNILLTEDGALKLARLSKAHIGKHVAIIIDGRVISTPRIMDEIIGGRVAVVGDFTAEEAESIAEGILVR